MSRDVKLLSLSINGGGAGGLQILCLGSHCDDIEIGCGGTLLKFIERYSRIQMFWVVFSSDEQRKEEALHSAHMFLKGVKESNVVIKTFTDSFFPYSGHEIKEYFEQLKQECSPDLVFTHYRNDLHQDHRLISELTWNTFRNHLILEYEIPKYDCDLGNPNVFVSLDESTCRRKVTAILASFKTQRTKRWFSKDTFLALLRLRGVESNSPTKFAEAFHGRKLTL